MLGNNQSHGCRLRGWREERGLSLEDVSALTGLSKPTLSLAERGLRTLSPMAKVRVARHLGVPVRDLFDPEGS